MMKGKKLVYLFIIIVGLSSIGNLNVAHAKEGDYTPPNFVSIYHYPVIPTQYDGVLIYAVVEDESGIGEINLVYNNGTDTYRTEMFYTPSIPLNDSSPLKREMYWASIPKHEANTQITYWVEADDSSANSNFAASLKYDYRVIKDNAPKIVIDRPDFLQHKNTTRIYLHIYDEDGINTPTCIYKYNNSINVLTGLVQYDINDTSAYYFDFPSGMDLNIPEGETIELWFNATEQSKYHQEGESVHLKLPILGTAPYLNNIYTSPIYPKVGENFTIQARIFYLDYINQTDVSNVVIDNVQADLITRTQSYSYYTQSFILNNSNYNPYNHSYDDYIFIGTASSPYVGKAEIKIKVFYHFETLNADGTKTISNTKIIKKSTEIHIIDNTPPEILSQDFTNTLANNQIYEDSTLEMRVGVKDDQSTRDVTVFIGNEQDTIGVQLRRDNTEFFAYNKFGDDGISFEEPYNISIEFNETISSFCFDGVEVSYTYFEKVYTFQEDDQNYLAFVPRDNLTDIYIKVYTNNYVNLDIYNQLLITAKALSNDTYSLADLRTDINDDNTIFWKYDPLINDFVFQENELGITFSETETIACLYSFTKDSIDTNAFYIHITGNFTSNDVLLLNSIRLLKRGQLANEYDSFYDHDFVYYYGHYYVQEQPTAILTAETRAHDGRNIQSSSFNTSVEVLDHTPPEIIPAEIFDIDISDTYALFSAKITDFSAVDQSSVKVFINYFYFNEDGTVANKTIIGNCTLFTDKDLEDIYIFNWTRSNDEYFLYKENVTYYFVAQDVYGNEGQSSIFDFTISEHISPNLSFISELSSFDYTSTQQLTIDIIDHESGLKEATVFWYFEDREMHAKHFTFNSPQTVSLSVDIGPFKHSGNLNYYIYIVDQAGNEYYSDIYTVPITDSEAPVLLPFFDPNTNNYRDYIANNDLEKYNSFYFSKNPNTLTLQIKEASELKAFTLTYSHYISIKDGDTINHQLEVDQNNKAIIYYAIPDWDKITYSQGIYTLTFKIFQEFEWRDYEYLNFTLKIKDVFDNELTYAFNEKVIIYDDLKPVVTYLYTDEVDYEKYYGQTVNVNITLDIQEHTLPLNSLTIYWTDGINQGYVNVSTDNYDYVNKGNHITEYSTTIPVDVSELYDTIAYYIEIIDSATFPNYEAYYKPTDSLYYSAAHLTDNYTNDIDIVRLEPSTTSIDLGNNFQEFPNKDTLVYLPDDDVYLSWIFNSTINDRILDLKNNYTLGSVKRFDYAFEYGQNFWDTDDENPPEYMNNPLPLYVIGSQLQLHYGLSDTVEAPTFNNPVNHYFKIPLKGIFPFYEIDVDFDNNVDYIRFYFVRPIDEASKVYNALRPIENITDIDLYSVHTTEIYYPGTYHFGLPPDQRYDCVIVEVHPHQVLDNGVYHFEDTEDPYSTFQYTVFINSIRNYGIFQNYNEEYSMFNFDNKQDMFLKRHEYELTEGKLNNTLALKEMVSNALGGDKWTEVGIYVPNSVYYYLTDSVKFVPCLYATTYGYLGSYSIKYAPSEYDYKDKRIGLILELPQLSAFQETIKNPFYLYQYLDFHAYGNIYSEIYTQSTNTYSVDQSLLIRNEDSYMTADSPFNITWMVSLGNNQLLFNSSITTINYDCSEPILTNLKNSYAWFFITFDPEEDFNLYHINLLGQSFILKTDLQDNNIKGMIHVQSNENITIVQRSGKLQILVPGNNTETVTINYMIEQDNFSTLASYIQDHCNKNNILLDNFLSKYYNKIRFFYTNLDLEQLFNTTTSNFIDFQLDVKADVGGSTTTLLSSLMRYFTNETLLHPNKIETVKSIDYLNYNLSNIQITLQNFYSYNYTLYLDYPTYIEKWYNTTIVKDSTYYYFNDLTKEHNLIVQIADNTSSLSLNSFSDYTDSKFIFSDIAYMLKITAYFRQLDPNLPTVDYLYIDKVYAVKHPFEQNTEEYLIFEDNISYYNTTHPCELYSFSSTCFVPLNFTLTNRSLFVFDELKIVFKAVNLNNITLNQDITLIISDMSIEGYNYNVKHIIVIDDFTPPEISCNTDGIGELDNAWTFDISTYDISYADITKIQMKIEYEQLGNIDDGTFFTQLIDLTNSYDNNILTINYADLPIHSQAFQVIDNVPYETDWDDPILSIDPNIVAFRHIKKVYLYITSIDHSLNKNTKCQEFIFNITDQTHPYILNVTGYTNTFTDTQQQKVSYTNSVTPYVYVKDTNSGIKRVYVEGTADDFDSDDYSDVSFTEVVLEPTTTTYSDFTKYRKDIDFSSLLGIPVQNVHFRYVVEDQDGNKQYSPYYGIYYKDDVAPVITDIHVCGTTTQTESEINVFNDNISVTVWIDEVSIDDNFNPADLTVKLYLQFNYTTSTGSVQSTWTQGFLDTQYALAEGYSADDEALVVNPPEEYVMNYVQTLNGKVEFTYTFLSGTVEEFEDYLNYLNDNGPSANRVDVPEGVTNGIIVIEAIDRYGNVNSENNFTFDTSETRIELYGYTLSSTIDQNNKTDILDKYMDITLIQTNNSVGQAYYSDPIVPHIRLLVKSPSDTDFTLVDETDITLNANNEYVYTIDYLNLDLRGGETIRFEITAFQTVAELGNVVISVKEPLIREFILWDFYSPDILEETIIPNTLIASQDSYQTITLQFQDKSVYTLALSDIDVIYYTTMTRTVTHVGDNVQLTLDNIDNDIHYYTLSFDVNTTGYQPDETFLATITINDECNTLTQNVSIATVDGTAPNGDFWSIPNKSYAVDTRIRIELQDYSDIDNSSVIIKYTFADGSWSSYYSMSFVQKSDDPEYSLYGGIYDYYIPAANHNATYTINIEVRAKDTVGNEGVYTLSFTFIDDVIPIIIDMNADGYKDVLHNPYGSFTSTDITDQADAHFVVLLYDLNSIDSNSVYIYYKFSSSDTIYDTKMSRNSNYDNGEFIGFEAIIPKNYLIGETSITITKVTATDSYGNQMIADTSEFNENKIKDEVLTIEDGRTKVISQQLTPSPDANNQLDYMIQPTYKITVQPFNEYYTVVSVTIDIYIDDILTYSSISLSYSDSNTWETQLPSFVDDFRNFHEQVKIHPTIVTHNYEGQNVDTAAYSDKSYTMIDCNPPTLVNQNIDNTDFFALQKSTITIEVRDLERPISSSDVSVKFAKLSTPSVKYTATILSTEAISPDFTIRITAEIDLSLASITESNKLDVFLEVYDTYDNMLYIDFNGYDTNGDYYPDDTSGYTVIESDPPTYSWNSYPSNNELSYTQNFSHSITVNDASGVQNIKYKYKFSSWSNWATVDLGTSTTITIDIYSSDVGKILYIDIILTDVHGFSATYSDSNPVTIIDDIVPSDIEVINNPSSVEIGSSYSFSVRGTDEITARNDLELWYSTDGGTTYHLISSTPDADGYRSVSLGTQNSLGTKTIYIKCTDEAGNTRIETFSYSVVDTTAPTIDATIKTDLGDNQDETFTATITDNVAIDYVKFYYTKNSGTTKYYETVTQDGTTYSATIPNSELSYGDTITYYWEAHDTSNNIKTFQKGATVSIDQTAPSISNVHTTSTQYNYNQAVVVYATVTDSSSLNYVRAYTKFDTDTTWSSYVTMSLDSGNTYKCTFSESLFSWHSSSPYYDVKIVAQDVEGNTKTLAFEDTIKIVDTINPSYSNFHCGDSYVYTNEQPWIYIDATEPSDASGIKSVTIQYYSSAWVSMTTQRVADTNTYKAQFTNAQSYPNANVNFRAVIKDNAGNTITTSTLTIYVHYYDENPPAINNVYIYWREHNPLETGDKFHVRATVSDPDDDISEVKVEYYKDEGSRTHYWKTTTFDGTYYKATYLPCSDTRYVKTYYRFKATNDMGIVSYSSWYYTYPSVISGGGGGFVSIDKITLKSYFFDTSIYTFYANFSNYFDHFKKIVQLHIYTSNDIIVNNMHVADLDTELWSVNLSEIVSTYQFEQFSFSISIRNLFGEIYHSEVQTVKFGDIIAPTIISVKSPTFAYIGDKVSIQAFVSDKHTCTVSLQLLNLEQDNSWKVYRTISMSSDPQTINLFTTQLNIKQRPGYYYRIVAEDEAGNKAYSKIYRLLSGNKPYTNHSLETLLIGSLIILSSISIIFVFYRKGLFRTLFSNFSRSFSFFSLNSLNNHFINKKVSKNE